MATTQPGVIELTGGACSKMKGNLFASAGEDDPAGSCWFAADRDCIEWIGIPDI